jgi:ribosome biogenesis GTPase A
MTQKYCRGCGTPLQTTNQNQPGFVPAELLDRKSSSALICKRCYRIIHYGESSTVQPDSGEILNNIRKAISLSQLLVIMTDFADLTGTLPVWSSFLGDKPYILAVNKIDLIPARGKYPEVAAYLHEYLRKLQWPKPVDVVLVSSVKGNGVEVLSKCLFKSVSPNDKIALLGVTNVGKSSLIKRILAEDAAQAPTISKFPGTTMGLSNWSIFKGRNTIIDTPGMVSGDRLGDLVCPECASSLMPVSEIGQKLWGIKPGKGLIIDGVFAVENHSNNEAVFIAFGSPQANYHRTDNAKIEGFLAEGPDWVNKVCKKCRTKLAWCQETVVIKPDHDLAVAGLGWISLRGSETPIKFTLPKGVRWEIRPALVGKRD